MARRTPAAKKSRSVRPKRGLSFDDVVMIGRQLPEVVESSSYGTRALKVDKTLIARLKEDGETLVLKMDIVSRDLLLGAQPDLFCLTDHYRDYPYVLVRLAAVTTDEMRELLEDAWRLAAPCRLIAQLDSPDRAAPASASRKRR